MANPDVGGQDALKRLAAGWVKDNEAVLTGMARQIWENPEECQKETFACKLQKDYLAAQGFRITDSQRAPTGFMAEYGEGKPVLGVLGEYDALKKLSQGACTERKILKEGGPGHGCGHNLLGTGCLGGAVAVKELMAQGKLKGTIRYYGCPAEEMLVGKVLMAEEGLFDGLDACLTWHSAAMTSPWAGSLLALYSAEFTFKGKSAHAGMAPHLGRSALDAVELMDTGANFMREHVVEQTRIHYIITKGGAEPNTVPAEAAVWYNLRSPSKALARESFQWLVEIARGAAMMTQTQLADIHVIAGCYEVLPNQVLVKLLGRNMNALGGPDFSEEDKAFAASVSGSYDRSAKAKALEAGYVPLRFLDESIHDGVEPPHDFGLSQKASTDVGDVSHIVPTAMFGVATWPLGVANHTWQAVAASGSGMGFHSMHYAAKVLASSLVELYQDPAVLQAAKEEFAQATAGEKYQPVFAEKF